MQIHHIAIYVSDLEEVSRFFEKYTNVLKIDLYHNPQTGFTSRFLHMESGAALELMHRDSVTAEHETTMLGYHHIAFALESEEAVDHLTEQIWNDGYRVVSGPRITGDGYYEAVIEGPENIQIELTYKP